MTINLKGMFDNTDSFVKHFNEVMTGAGIRRMKYIASLYELQIQHLDGINFSLEEYRIMMMAHFWISLVLKD